MNFGAIHQTVIERYRRENDEIKNVVTPIVDRIILSCLDQIVVRQNDFIHDGGNVPFLNVHINLELSLQNPEENRDRHQRIMRELVNSLERKKINDYFIIDSLTIHTIGVSLFDIRIEPIIH